MVTEDDHPDWVDLTIEEMYDELMKERQQEDPTPDDVQDQQNQSSQDGSQDQSQSGQSGQSQQGQN